MSDRWSMISKNTMSSRGSARARRGTCFLWLLLAVCYSPLTGALRAQTPALTTVKDTVYRSDGALASGSVVISWEPFVTADSKPVFGGTKTIPLVNGALAVALVPNAGGSPSGTSYRVRYYQSGGVFFEETWVVPTSSPLPSPPSPTVTVHGASGTTIYCYWVSAASASGETLLSAASCVSNGNASLNGANYNQVSWPAVPGAASYRVYRTGNQNSPSGTGAYLAGTTTGTSLNDQSSSLATATIPSLNTTDPRTLSGVRVTAAPSSSVMLSAQQVTGTSIVANPSATQSITAPASSGIPLQVIGRSSNASNVFETYDNQATPQLKTYVNASGSLRTQNLNAVRFADQFPGSDAGAKIAAAIADLPATGGTVDARGFEGAQAISGTLTISKPVKLLLGKATFTMTGGATELIKITSAGVEIAGTGWDSVLQVGSSVGLTVDAIRVVGANDIVDLNFHDFAISPQAGTPGRYGINFDNTNNYVSYVVMNRLSIGPLGSYAVQVTNPTPLANGGLFTSVLQNSTIVGGINLSKAGDSIRLENNTITGPRGLLVDLVSGAYGPLIQGNSITAAAGIRVLNGLQTQIVGNNIEQTTTSTEPNNALIDIDGSSGSRVISTVVADNYVGGNGLYVADAIRINYADGTVLRGNRTVRGSGVAYRVTANADGTQIREDREEPYGELPSSYLSDAGTRTSSDFVYPGSNGLRTLLGDLSLGSLNRTSAGTTDSSKIVFTGSSHDGVPHTPEWSLFSATTSNGGTSALTIQNRLDGDSWSNAFQILSDSTNRQLTTSASGTAALYATAGPVIGGLRADSGGAVFFGSASNHRADVITNNAVALSVSANKNTSLGGLVGGSEQLSLTSAGKIGWDSGSGAIDTNLYRGSAAVLQTDGSWSVARAAWSGLTSVAFSATPTFDASLGNSFKMTLNSNVTISTISNGQTGEVLRLLLCQDSSGSRTMSWPSNLKLAGGTFTLTTTPNKCDSVTAVYDGSNWYETSRAANL